VRSLDRVFSEMTETTELHKTGDGVPEKEGSTQFKRFSVLTKKLQEIVTF